MFRVPYLYLLCIPIVLLAIEDQPWQNKQIADWSEDDAHQVLSSSPWAQTVTPKIAKAANSGHSRGAGNMTQMGGVGMGLPGMGGQGGMGRHGRMSQDDPSQTTSTSNTPPPTLTIRWESALPVQAAELKAHNVDAPEVDEDHYALAVYGIPSRILNSDSQSIADQLKGQATLKREGKKDLKPSSVTILPRDSGTVVVYQFPRSKEITRQDKQVQFDARIGPFSSRPRFNLDDMIYRGKLQL